MQLLQLIQGSAFVRSRCSRSSYIEHNGPAEPRIVAGAAELVENGHDPSVPSRCQVRRFRRLTELDNLGGAGFVVQEQGDWDDSYFATTKLLGVLVHSTGEAVVEIMFATTSRL